MPIQAFDNVLKDYVTQLEKTRKKLCELSDGLKYDVHIGSESGRVWDGVMTVTFPEFIPGLRKMLCKQYLTKLDKAKITGISLI